MEICVYDRKQILQVYYALKDFLKSFITFRLLNGDMVFSRKTKVSCYKNEVNESVMLHAVFLNGIVLQCLTKTQKYPVTNKSIAFRLEKS